MTRCGRASGMEPAAIPKALKIFGFRRAAGHRHGFGKLGRVIALTRPNAFIFAQDCAISLLPVRRHVRFGRCAIVPSSLGGLAMNAMLTKYLKDFSVPQPSVPVGNDFLSTLPGAPVPNLDFAAEPKIDIEAERREAHQEGYDEAAAYFQAKHEEDLELMKGAHALQLQGLADAHESETIWMIHTRFHEMTQMISQTLAEQAFQVLLPVMQEQVARKAIDELAELVRQALAESAVTTVVVRGPERLYARLKPLLDIDGIESRFVENTSADISVEINDMVLLTRLANWAQALSEVTG